MDISIRLSVNFSAEILQPIREWQDMFQVLKGKNLQFRILYPARLLFRIKGKIKKLSEKERLKVFISMELTLKEMLKGLL